MKTLLMLIVFTVFTTSLSFGFSMKMDTLKVKTSAICGMCKTNIQNSMMYQKGVKSADLDLDSKVLTIVYNSSKTTPSKLRKAVNKTGYDADDTKANFQAFQKLPECCKDKSKCTEAK